MSRYKFFKNDLCYIPQKINFYEYFIHNINKQKRRHGNSNHCPIIDDFDELVNEHINEINNALNDITDKFHIRKGE
jgi:hypothetical protein